LTEAVANALDSGAAHIRLLTNPADATLTIVDDGRGMQRRELARYHDVAASTKARGEGIGFAGVGIKLGLLVSREVITETTRGATAYRHPPWPPAHAVRRRLSRTGCTAERSRRHRHQHVRQDHQARLGLARSHACAARARQWPD